MDEFTDPTYFLCYIFVRTWDHYMTSDIKTLRVYETQTSKYLETFKDHPYIFNLGHGILPETNPDMVENLIKIVKNN